MIGRRFAVNRGKIGRWSVFVRRGCGSEVGREVYKIEVDAGGSQESVHIFF